MFIPADTSKCRGQANNGTRICAYRDACLRYVAPAIEGQVWPDFWKHDDTDCKEFKAIVKVEA